MWRRGGGRDCGDGSSDHGRWKRLEGDVFEWAVGTWVVPQVAVDVVVLGGGQWDILLIGLFSFTLFDGLDDEVKEAFGGGITSGDGRLGGGADEVGRRLVVNKEGRGDVGELEVGEDVAGTEGKDWTCSSGTWVVPSVVGAVENVFKDP